MFTSYYNQALSKIFRIFSRSCAQTLGSNIIRAFAKNYYYIAYTATRLLDFGKDLQAISRKFLMIILRLSLN